MKPEWDSTPDMDSILHPSSRAVPKDVDRLLPGHEHVLHLRHVATSGRGGILRRSSERRAAYEASTLWVLRLATRVPNDLAVLQLLPRGCRNYFLI